jgi:hypothetical protein
MFRGRLVIVGLAVLVAMTAQAGEVKLHNWPVQFRYVPLEVTNVDVVMDIGYWIEIINQNKVLKLQQVSLREYEGSLDLQVRCNFNLTFVSEIVPNGTVGGTYSSSFVNPDIDAPGGTATLQARLEDADIGSVQGGTFDVQVASIVVKVVPR